MDRTDDELVIRGPIMVPFGWLIAIIGAAGSAFVLAFAVGVWVATVSTKTDAHTIAIEKLQESNLSDRVVRIETILTMVYPEQAKKARRMPAQADE